MTNEMSRSRVNGFLTTQGRRIVNGAGEEVLLDDVVDRAKEYLHSKYLAYQEHMNPLLDEEVDKLIELQNKHHQYYQMTLFEQERKLEQKERSVDELFERFINWVTDTLTIQNNPYIRIAAVLTGVTQ